MEVNKDTLQELLEYLAHGVPRYINTPATTEAWQDQVFAQAILQVQDRLTKLEAK